MPGCQTKPVPFHPLLFIMQIILFFARIASCHVLEKVLSPRIVMFHVAECFVHDEVNCAQVRETYSTVQ
jgi:hypothetical protein